MSARACRARMIVVRPMVSSPLASQDNTIIGNTVLYGATAGQAVRRGPCRRALRGAQFRRAPWWSKAAAPMAANT